MLQGINMFFKGFLAQTGNPIFGVGFFANKGFFNFDICRLFKGFGMACQISVGYIQEFLEPVKVHIIVHHENGHDTQSNAMVKKLVYVVNKSHVMPFPL